jgi:hypothetical protein
MENIAGRKYPTIGQCIYCGCTGGLQDEHIIPLALAGTAVLPKSSCGACAKITGEQERIVLRGSMWPVRVFRGLKSRRKHRVAPKSYPLTVVRQGAEEIVQLPAAEYPILLPFPIFAPPAFVDTLGRKTEIEVMGVRTISFGPVPQDVARKLGATSIKIEREDQPVAFARVIAKIAYGFAAAEGILDLIDGTPVVVQSMLGSANDIGRWVGTLSGTPQSFTGQLHRVLFHRDDENGIIWSEVQLFSDSHAPCYIVILGRARR